MKLRFLLPPVALIFFGCSRSSESASTDRAPTVSVSTAVVTASRTMRTQAVAGTVRPFSRATIAAKITGTVASTSLAVGRAVTAGEVLLTLQAAELDARVDQAHAALAQAEREYERERTMEAQGASTTESVRGADDRRRLSRAAAQEAEAMLGYTKIVAPFSGVLTAELVKAGDLATPGRPLFEIEGTDHLRAEVQVPESLPLPGANSTIAVVLGEKTLIGQLVELSPSADPASRTRLAKIELPSDAVARSGQFVRVLWPASEEVALTVPATAVSVLGQMERVFVVSKGKAQLRLVKTGGRDRDRIEIASGLDEGEHVVVSPPSALRDGQSVETKP